MTRYSYIEQVRRDIYGGQPNDDAEITINLVNQWLDQAIGIAAKTNYTDSLKLDGIAYMNGSFYTTYKGLSVTSDEQFIWRITLPHIPFGIGNNEGVSTLKFKDASSSQISQPVIWLNQNQWAYFQNMRQIPNSLYANLQGEYIYIISTILLFQYTAQVVMVSGGDSTNLYSTLNVPADYLPIMTDYLKQQLMFERSAPKDVTADGMDAIKTT